MTDEEKIKFTLEFIADWGSTDGSHHKQWALDQVVRILTETPEAYLEWVRQHNDGEDGAETYDWDTGIAP